MKIAVAGLGYVGLSLAILLSQKNEVLAFDISKQKVDLLNKRVSPIKDDDIEYFLNTKTLNLEATIDYELAFKDAQYIIICTPTNYNEKLNTFDTSSVEDVIQKIVKMHLNTTIIIKSTVPVGFVKMIREKYNYESIIFSPEFLREGRALYDNLFPSRIIVGEKSKRALDFALLLRDNSLNDKVEIKLMDSSEAEAVKLFANTYLALRIAFFNELDTFSELKHLNARDIIEGVCLDSRIGDYYNNPSFGYGGYCLPKDTKQLKYSYQNVPENIISAIIQSNDTRKKHIVNMILEKKPKVVGIYRLTMKNNSDNFRSSAILDIIKMLKSLYIDIIIYEPLLTLMNFENCNVVNDFETFKHSADVILINRMDDKALKLGDKIYTRDIFHRD